MRFVDFLIHLLATQSQTIQRLAAFFGEEELLEMLESAGEHEVPSKNSPSENSSLVIDPNWFEDPPKPVTTSAYRELEGAVKEFNLPEVFEFHLWTYPFYRELIESPVSLDAVIKAQEPNPGIENLIHFALKHSEEWIKRLPISPVLSIQAERIATLPWLRFRAEVLKKLGRRVVETVKL